MISSHLDRGGGQTTLVVVAKNLISVGKICGMLVYAWLVGAASAQDLSTGALSTGTSIYDGTPWAQKNSKQEKVT